MKRFIAIAASIAVLAIAVAACAPPKAPVSAPPPPPKFKLAAGLWHTFGTAPGASECSFVRMDSEGHKIPGSEEHSKTGQRYIETKATDSEFVTSGCQKWVLADSPEDQHHLGVWGIPFDPRSTGFHLASGDGDYRLGNTDSWNLANWTGDIPYGRYGVSGPDCRWQVLRNFSGEYFSVWNQGDGTGDGRRPGLQSFGTTNANPPGYPYPNAIVGIRVSNCSPGGYMYWYGGDVTGG